ncbi:hypothetical protein LguiA_014362 [Lonicera macranthoides]
MVAGSLYLPKDNILKPRGEDAHFLCIERQTVGVADGVGGWATKGVDAGVYARELMAKSHMATYSEANATVDPKRVLEEAFKNTKAQGSSTACILALNNNILRAVNVGDSGFMVIRNKRVIYKSPKQQRSFNCPYQLGITKDKPSSAQKLEVAVELGDILVAGTDGLFDNMHAFEIEDVVNRGINEGEEPEEIACVIANLALYNSFDQFADTPFAKASRLAGHEHRGGKIDDITVIVAYIQGQA